jgi:hypothetical protein
LKLSLNDWKSTLRQVIEMLHSYDRQMMEADMFTRVPSSRPTYKNFANRHGVHFDAQGNLIEVQAEKPVTADTFMTRKSLNDLYNQQAKKVDYSTWQAVYDNLVNKQFEGATVEMLAGDKGPMRNT